MRPPKGKPFTAPAMEIDLSRIQQLSQEHDDENWEFRSWLKQNAPNNIDGVVNALSQKYFALIDCTQCANCCRSLQTEFKKSERASYHCNDAWAIDRSVRKTIHDRRRGESAVPNAEREALFDLRE